MKEWGVNIGCVNCNHLIFKKLDKCKAFPRRIPYLIRAGSFDHRKRFPGQDNDIVFEERKKKET